MANKLLATIAHRLGRSSLDHLAPDALEEQFAALKISAPPPTHPAGESDTQIWFEHQARANLFDVLSVSSREEIPSLFSRSSLPVALSPQESVRSLPWYGNENSVTDNYIEPVLGIFEADYGIAETGTVMTSTGAIPSSMLFLSEELAVILPKNRIMRFQEDVWCVLSGARQRAIHLISGPSRTADVEQTLQVGAHGPRKVYLVLVEH